RGIERGNNGDAQLQREELAPEVVVGGGAHVGPAPTGRLVPDELDAVAREYVARLGQERVGDRLVHEERLRRVAHARAAGLRVHEDVERHVEVGGGVDVHVAVAVAVDDRGDGRVLAHALEEGVTTARDEAVDGAGELHQ